MSAIFGTPDTGPQREQIRKQEEQTARQEAALSRERTDLAERAMAAARARRGGGLRALLSAERPDELGVQPTKLGGGT